MGLDVSHRLALDDSGDGVTATSPVQHERETPFVKRRVFLFLAITWFVLAGCGRPQATGRTTTTTTGTPTTMAPTTTTTKAATPLQTVSWGAVTVPASVCPDLSHSVTLSQSAGATFGSATIPAPAGLDAGTPDVLIEETDVFYGTIQPDREVAALYVWCTNTGGTADGQIQNSLVIYEAAPGGPQAIATLTPRQRSVPGTHVPYFAASPSGVVIGTGSITTQEVWYGPKDPTCCPTGRSTTVWTFDGSSFSPSTTTQVQPEGS